MKSAKVTKGRLIQLVFPDTLNDGFYWDLICLDKAHTKSALPSFGYMQNDSLTQYLGGTTNQNSNELLTHAHYDNEVNILGNNLLVLHTRKNILDAGSLTRNKRRSSWINKCPKCHYERYPSSIISRN